MLLKFFFHDVNYNFSYTQYFNKFGFNPALCRLKNEYFMHVGPPRPAPSTFYIENTNFFGGWKISRRVKEKFTLWFQVTKIEIEGAMAIIFFFGPLRPDVHKAGLNKRFSSVINQVPFFRDF